MLNKKRFNTIIAISGIGIALTLLLGTIGPKFGPFGASIESIAGYVVALFSPMAGGIVGVTGYIWLTIMGNGFIFGFHHIFIAIGIFLSMYIFGIIAKKNFILAIMVAFIVNMSGLTSLLIDQNWRAAAIAFAPWLALATGVALVVTIAFKKATAKNKKIW